MKDIVSSFRRELETPVRKAILDTDTVRPHRDGMLTAIDIVDASGEPALTRPETEERVDAILQDILRCIDDYATHKVPSQLKQLDNAVDRKSVV